MDSRWEQNRIAKRKAPRLNVALFVWPDLIRRGKLTVKKNVRFSNWEWLSNLGAITKRRFIPAAMIRHSSTPGGHETPEIWPEFGKRCILYRYKIAENVRILDTHCIRKSYSYRIPSKRGKNLTFDGKMNIPVIDSMKWTTQKYYFVAFGVQLVCFPLFWCICAVYSVGGAGPVFFQAFSLFWRPPGEIGRGFTGRGKVL